MFKILAAVCICLSIASACSKKETAPKKVSQDKVLVIGLIPEQHIFEQMERYKPLAEYLSRKTGAQVRLKVLPRYGNIIDNFVSAGMDGAFFGSFTYTLAHARLGVEVLARPEGLDGMSTYYGLIFVRKDSGIKGIKDMKGKRFAFVDKATTAGYLLPLKYFSKNGITNYRTYLGEAYFTGTHEDAINDVLDRKADIGAAKNTVYERMLKENDRIMSKLVVLEKSPRVPENGLAVRKDMEVSLKKKLKETLLSMHNDPDGGKVLKELGVRKFIETTDADYEPVVRYAREIGLDLSTYNYANN